MQSLVIPFRPDVNISALPNIKSALKSVLVEFLLGKLLANQQHVICKSSVAGLVLVGKMLPTLACLNTK